MSCASWVPAATEGSALQVGELRPEQELECDRFVLSCEHGTPFHLAAWRRVVRDVLGRKTITYVAQGGGRITGLLPVSVTKNPLFGSCLVSLPLAVYGGVCAEDAESYGALLEAGRELANREGVKYLELRNFSEPFEVPESLARRDLYVTLTQDLTPGPDKLLAAMPRDTRYAIRKSLKAGLEWCEDLSLDDFYEIYAHSVHRLGTPVFAKKLFRRVQQEYGKQCRIFGVRKNGIPIAGVLTLYYKDAVLPYYGGALVEYYRDSPNNFMYWNLMVQSCNEGYRSFDFGRSKRNTGSLDFKSAWGMKVTPLAYRYHLARAKAIPEMSPVDKKFQLPVAAWKKLPFSWTKVLGPRIVRAIPSV